MRSFVEHEGGQILVEVYCATTPEQAQCSITKPHFLATKPSSGYIAASQYILRHNTPVASYRCSTYFTFAVPTTFKPSNPLSNKTSLQITLELDWFFFLSPSQLTSIFFSISLCNLKKSRTFPVHI